MDISAEGGDTKTVHTQSSWGSPPSLGAHTHPALCAETSQCSCLSLIPCLAPQNWGLQLMPPTAPSAISPLCLSPASPEAVAPQGDELVPNFSGLLCLSLEKTQIISGETLQPCDAGTA